LTTAARNEDANMAKAFTCLTKGAANIVCVEYGRLLEGVYEVQAENAGGACKYCESPSSTRNLFQKLPVNTFFSFQRRFTVFCGAVDSIESFSNGNPQKPKSRTTCPDVNILFIFI
jgi:hypothetical protein